MGIGQLRCHVFHVEDLDVGQRFWAAVTGLDPIPSVFPGRTAYLGQADPWHHEVILYKVDSHKGPEANRSHVDIWVRDVDVAIEQVLAIGGSLKRPPTIYPRPGSYGDEPARIDWAIMQDPFGNEFCLVSTLTRDEATAVAGAAAAVAGAGASADGTADTGDDTWRQAAGRARRAWWTSDEGRRQGGQPWEHE